VTDVVEVRYMFGQACHTGGTCLVIRFVLEIDPRCHNSRM
jgi:hypothetical protein